MNERIDRLKRAITGKTKEADAVKKGAKKLRELGKSLAKQVESVTAEAGAKAVGLEAKLKKAEATLLAARKRAEGPAKEIAGVAKGLAKDLRKQAKKKR